MSGRAVAPIVALGLLVAAFSSAPTGAANEPVLRAAPYEYLGWGSPQPPADVMAATGVRNITLAFILTHGACNPMWDGNRPLLGGTDQAAINAIRAAGGDVVLSFGGWSGTKLGTSCKTPAALAAAYQKVVNDYALHAIDIDIEHTEMTNKVTRHRVVSALALLRAANPGLEIAVTFGTTPTGPDATGESMIADAAAQGFQADAWTIMPFDFGANNVNIGQASVAAVQGLAQSLAASYGISLADAYQHAGISSMNGLTDSKGENVSLADFETMLAFAQQQHLARFTFWSVKRDRQCAKPSTKAADDCSGVAQSAYAYTDVIARYHG